MDELQDVYDQFARELTRHDGDGIHDLLNDESGLALRWAAICQHKLQDLPSDDSIASSAYSLEHNTWQLIQALYAERLAPPVQEATTSKNPYTAPLTVVQKIIESDKSLVELSAIRDWLHSIPSSLNPSEIRRGYLPYTKSLLSTSRLTSSLSSLPPDLVRTLDPDASLHSSPSLKIASSDLAYERALVRSLFEYVRVGELDYAVDMCRQSDMSWRAASLSGGGLWWDRRLGREGDEDEDGEEERDGMDDQVTEKVLRKGNLNRRLWKAMCRKLASNPNLDHYERALYGSLSGDIPSVLPVCTTWEDHLWAHISSLFETRIESLLSSSLEGRYWSKRSKGPLPTPAGGGGEGELKEIFERLMRSERRNVKEESRDPLRIAQMMIILGKEGELIEEFVERLEVTVGETERETVTHLLRFFAHLVLYLRRLNQPLPDAAANRILEAYVQVLETNDQDENLIAFYASNLDDSSAIESYARCLLTFGPESDRTSRQVALLKAKEHGLDLSRIACRTVELILEDMREGALETTFDAPFDAYARLDARQIELVRAIEWLTFDRSTYPQALRQTNALARYFLSTDLPHAARELLVSLPTDLLPATAAASNNDSTHVREHLDYVTFFDCLEKHTRWAEIWAMKPRPGAPKLDAAAFKDGVAKLVDDFYAAAIDLLEADWLKIEFEELTEDDARRQWELKRIRQLLIPHLVLRLYHTLYETRIVIPSNLQRALDLANLVADERHQLYLEFITEEKNRIPDFLEQVRLAGLAALDGGSAFSVGGGSKM